MHGVPGFTKLVGILLGGWFSEFHSMQGTARFVFSKKHKIEFSANVGVGRIAGSHLHKDYDTVFTGSQTGTSNNDWKPWEGVILLNFRNYILLGACFYIHSIEYLDFRCSRC